MPTLVCGVTRVLCVIRGFNSFKSFFPQSERVITVIARLAKRKTCGRAITISITSLLFFIHDPGLRNYNQLFSRSNSLINDQWFNMVVGVRTSAEVFVSCSTGAESLLNQNEMIENSYPNSECDDIRANDMGKTKDQI